MKPAENHPQVIFLEFKRSPMFFPTMDIAPEDCKKLGEQSSPTGQPYPKGILICIAMNHWSAEIRETIVIIAKMITMLKLQGCE
ncbi:MAG: hypothetical protein WAM14_21635 [Candidatus Nitrosopolaris sp.]